MAVDAHVYYCLIRQNRPRRILEVGVGKSTLLAIAANAYNEQDGRRTASHWWIPILGNCSAAAIPDSMS